MDGRMVVWKGIIQSKPVFLVPPQTEDGRTAETQKRGKLGNQKYREINNHRFFANRRHPNVLTFIFSPQIG